MSLEGLNHAIQALLAGVDNTYDVTVEQQNEVENEEEGAPNEYDSSPPILGQLLDSNFQANIETVHNNQHPYNTHSKDHPKEQNTSTSDANKNETLKQKKQTETSKIFLSL